MKYWLSFCGCPMSGHTLVAAILNANPNVICSNQLHVYKNASVDFDVLKEHSENHITWKSSNRVPHVPKQEITVMGDKTVHRTIDLLSKDPKKLGEFREFINVPIKWIHIVRNPYDNIATWARLEYESKKADGIETTQKRELNTVIEEFARLNRTISQLRRSEDVITVNYEYIITRMHNTLEEMANFLEISFDPEWRDNVRNTVWKKPRIARNTVKWTPQQRVIVQEIINDYPWLNGYYYSGCGRC